MFSVVGASGESYLVEDRPFNTSGGQSDLFRCRDPRGRERVYKRYRSPLTETEPMVWVADVARTGREIVAAAERARTMAETASSSLNWPIDVIRDGAGVLGVVLPFIPPPFLQADGRPLTFDYLCLASAHPPDAAFRVGVLIRMCDIFKVLARDRLIHGDVSAKNIVWRRDRPHAYLIDCDGMRPADSHAERGVGTEGWKDPRWIDGRIPAHDEYSDRFALAVLMYRGLLLNPGAPTLVQGQWIKPSGIPADLDPRLRELFGRAFDDPFVTDHRPAATEWLDVLKAVVLTPDGAAYRPEALAVLDRHAQQFRDETPPMAPQPVALPPVPVATVPPPMPLPLARPSANGRVAAAVVAAVVLIALLVVLVLALRDNGTHAVVSSTATTASSTTASSSQYGIGVGGCVTVTTEGQVTGGGACGSGTTTYQVTAMAPETAGSVGCTSADDNRTAYDGYLLCLRPLLADHHCYRIPPQDSSDWITVADSCDGSGTATVTGIEAGSDGSDHDAFCHHGAYRTYRDPSTLYCLDEHR